MAKTGDTVQILLKTKQVLNGVMLPSQESEQIVLKQDSGYNIVLDKSSIKSTKVIKIGKEKKIVEKKIVINKKLPTIAIVFTGGTIASKVDYETGGVKPLFSSSELAEMFPEFTSFANIETYQVANELSSNIDFKILNKLAKQIASLENKVKGVIVAHGTDTLHYSSSFISFMLEGINIPVIFVGSQRSADRGSTDSVLNVLSAGLFITRTELKGVAICMHETSDDDTCLILPAHNTRKMHTSRRDAFRPINGLPIADIDFNNKEISYYRDYNTIGGKVKVFPLNEKLKIGWLKHRPGILKEEFLHYKDFDGLIIEGTGLGHVNDESLEVIKKLKIPMIMTPQCLYGRVDMSVYYHGRMFMEAGIIPSNQGLTPETAYAKLCWLLSNFPKEKVSDLFKKDFRGENIPRITEETFLL